jgi:hypothetical protein
MLGGKSHVLTRSPRISRRRPHRLRLLLEASTSIRKTFYPPAPPPDRPAASNPSFPPLSKVDVICDLTTSPKHALRDIAASPLWRHTISQHTSHRELTWAIRTRSPHRSTRHQPTRL